MFFLEDTGVKLWFLVVSGAGWVDPSDGDCGVECMPVSGAEAVDAAVSVAVVGDALVGVVVLVDAVVAVAMVGDVVVDSVVVGDDVVVGVALKVAEKLSSGVRPDWSSVGVVRGDFDECAKLVSGVSSELVWWILEVDIGVEGERSEDWKGIGREEGEGACWVGGGRVSGNKGLWGG